MRRHMTFETEYQALLSLSARVGADPLLVQAAGGNTSIKQDGLMWIKASGTWLKDALTRDIMVPVRDADLRRAIAERRPSAERAVEFVVSEQARTTLRPSIETVVHALMPQRVVVHVHCVETIALAVRADCETLLRERLAGLDHAFIPYVRPGLPLAEAIAARLRPETDVLVLGNHGLVVSAGTVAGAEALLGEVTRRLATEPRPSMPADVEALGALSRGTDFVLPGDGRSHDVATDRISCRFAAGGSMYPDHVIFLGPGSTVAEPGETVADVLARVQVERKPPPVALLFPGKGVLVRSDASAGALALQRCLAEVTARIPVDAPVRYLSAVENDELLNWDAEKYRQSLNERQ